MSGKLNHRHVSLLPDVGGDVSSPEWNDSIIASEGSDGQVMARDSTQPDGWKWTTVTASPSDTAAYASIPAPSVADTGRFFAPNNGHAIYRDSGTAWVPWGPIWQLTDPLLQTWAWVNQGAAAIDSTRGGVYLSIAAATDAQIHLRAKSAPATPYTITALIIPDQAYLTFTVCGIGWRQSSDGKLVNVGWVGSSASAFGLAVSKWTSPSAFSADYAQSPTAAVWWGSASHQVRPLWLQISDDGANRIVRISNDGYHFHQIHSVGRTDFMTADQVMFFVGGDASFAQAEAMWLLSWKES